jgi:hypothetical protein
MHVVTKQNVPAPSFVNGDVTDVGLVQFAG